MRRPTKMMKSQKKSLLRLKLCRHRTERKPVATASFLPRLLQYVKSNSNATICQAGFMTLCAKFKSEQKDQSACVAEIKGFCQRIAEKLDSGTMTVEQIMREVENQ